MEHRRASSCDGRSISSSLRRESARASPTMKRSSPDRSLRDVPSLRSRHDHRPVLLNPRGRYPERFRLHPMDCVNQLLERHGEIGVHYHLVEEMRVKKLYPLGVVQDLMEFLVLQSNKDIDETTIVFAIRSRRCLTLNIAGCLNITKALKLNQIFFIVNEE